MKRILAAVMLAALSFGAQGASRVFYDGFENSTTTKFAQDSYRNRCTVVSTAVDGKAGPFAGTKMAKCHDSASTVAWNDPAAFETLVIPPEAAPYTSELFIRFRIRRDTNHQVTAASPKKCCRVYVPGAGVGTPTYTDMFESFYYYQGAVSQVYVGGTQWPTYWGGAAGDQLGNPSGWHKEEIYIGPGRVRVWHDGVKVEDFAATTNANKFLPFYLMSNWADAHVAGDIYVDEVEVYSDQNSGTAVTGLMSDATVAAAVATTPPPVDTSALQAQVDSLTAQVAALTAAGVSKDAANASLQAQIAALQAQIAALQVKINNAKAALQ